MKSASKKRQALKTRRKARVRKKISGVADKPRLSLFRSARHVYAQVIDDVRGHTLVSSSSFEKGQHKSSNVKGCTEIGVELAKRCLELNITRVCFDRNGNMYHGRVKAFADGARQGGLIF